MATRSILLRKANTSSFLRHQQLRWKNGRWFRPANLSSSSQRLVSTVATTSNSNNFNHNLRPTRQQQQQSSNNQNDLNLWAAVTATVGISAYALQKDAQPSKCDVAAADNRRKTTERRQPHNVMLHRKRSIRGRNLNEKYNVDWSKCLGEGAYGSVHPARLAATGEKVALKKISKRYTSTSSFKTETDALLRIYDNGGHPNISGLRDMYEDYSNYYMILDLVSGGEMFEHLINNGAYAEKDASRLIYEALSALAFLHGVGVVHADLKPENLLLCSKNRREGTIKIIDFGCAVVSADDAQKGTARPAGSSGTTAYWPPERFKEGATTDAAMDMWSLGVILYIMLTGVHPFDLDGLSTDEEIEDVIKEDPRPPQDGFTDHLSSSAIDAMHRLMEPDPAKRATAYEMLQHPWVRGETASGEKIADSDKRLSRFKDLRNQVEAGIFAVLVSQGHQDVRLSEASPEVIKKQKTGNNRNGTKPTDTSSHMMKRAFDIFDTEGKGFVTSADLGRVVKQRTGSHLSSRETQAFLATQQGGSAEPLSLTDFEKLSKGLKQRHFPRGHVIFHAGDEGDAMYFLNSGKVEIQTRKGQLVAILRSGDFFGEGSLLSDADKRFTTAKCATPVDVLEIKKDDFNRYVASSESTRHELQLKWRARNLAYAKNLIRLQKNVRIRTLKRGQVVYREGDDGKFMYRVCDEKGGEFDVSHEGKTVHKYLGGDHFGESALLFERPRSSTVTCASKKCRLYEMRGEDFLAVVNASPEMASVLRNMCRKRLFKKAVKTYALERGHGVTDDDIVAAFHHADIDNNGALTLEEVRRLMHRMDPNFPMEEIRALLKFIDVDEDGMVSLEEFKQLFRQFEDEKI